jgi:hypothetical protein
VTEPGTLSAVGVDDFAFRHGRNYGTICIPAGPSTCCRTMGDTFADWLRASRRRSDLSRPRWRLRRRSPARSTRRSPDGGSVALLYNLTDAVDKVVRAHWKCLRDQPAPDAVAQPAPQEGLPEGRRAELTRQRHAEVHALHERGVANCSGVCECV